MNFRTDDGPPDETKTPAPDETGTGAEDASGGKEGEEDSSPSADELKGGNRSENIAAAALAWAEAGYPVFPCRNCPGLPGHKAPLTPHGFKDASKEEQQISDWWTTYPTALIAIPTGALTGIAVLDLDRKNGKDGLAVVPNWRELSSVVVETPSGGAHIYFRADAPIPCSTGRDGVDVRGDGGYVIAPPSPGYRYSKSSDLLALPLFPDQYRPRHHFTSPGQDPEADPRVVAAALLCIPNDDVGYDDWVRVGLATFRATGGSGQGLAAWHSWSEKSGKYDPEETERRWLQFHRSPPDKIGAGTLFYMANEADPHWRALHDAEFDKQAEAAFEEGAAEFGGGAAGADEPGTEDESQKAEEPKNGLGEWDAGKDDTAIPPREWLLGNSVCRGYTSGIVAPGGVGKTALALLQATSLATGRPLTSEKVFQRCRVLFVSLEDDPNELKRRLEAILLHHRIKREELDDWLFLSAPEGKAGKLVTVDPRTRRPTLGPMKAELDRVIVERRIDVLFLDPLVKAHDVEENDNSAMDFVIQVISRLAFEHNIAVVVLHHTSKGAAEPGNADRSRGASAVVNGARLVYTLTTMSPAEAKEFGTEEAQRRLFVRLDSGKVNIAPPLEEAKWFRLVGVPLGNGDARQIHKGDNVQTVETWTPPGVWEGVTVSALQSILDAIEAGVPADEAAKGKPGSRYSTAGAAKSRAAWPLVVKYAPSKNEQQAKRFIGELIRRGRIVERHYHDPNAGEGAKGLFVVTAEEAENAPM